LLVLLLLLNMGALIIKIWGIELPNH
jgi:hypothetical protein